MWKFGREVRIAGLQGRSTLKNMMLDFCNGPWRNNSKNANVDI